MLKLTLIDDDETVSPYERIAKRARNFRFTAVVGGPWHVLRRWARAGRRQILHDLLQSLLLGHSAAFDGVVLDQERVFNGAFSRPWPGGKHILAPQSPCFPPPQPLVSLPPAVPRTFA